MKKIIRSVYFWITRLVAILSVPFILPRQIPSSGITGICSLVCHRDVVMFIYMLHSFYYYSQISLPCTVLDDGSLTSNDIRTIHKHFPGITILKKQYMDVRMKKKLREFPMIQSFRKKHNIHKFHLKLTDPFILPLYNRIIYIDSDVLFVNTPVRIQKWINTSENTYLYEPEYRTKDWGIGDGWSFAGNAIREALGIKFNERFNSGLLCVNKRSYPLKFLNKVVSYMHRVEMDKTWLAEQYATAAAFSYKHAETLGRKYKHLALPNFQVFRASNAYVCIHFAYLAKPYFYGIALKQLIQSRFFSS